MALDGACCNSIPGLCRWEVQRSPQTLKLHQPQHLHLARISLGRISNLVRTYPAAETHGETMPTPTRTRGKNAGLFLIAASVLVAAHGLNASAQNNQTPADPAASQNSRGTTVPPATSKPTRHIQRRAPKPVSSTTVIGIETAPPSPPASVQADAASRAADQRLLQQQQSQSNKAAAINDQQVQKAQKTQEQMQRETRIQDVPGPAPSGIVPAAGAPGVVPGSDQRSQDAAAPTQTSPAQTSPTQTPPAQPSQRPAQTPPATPPQ